jgi:biopolymer transport protein ExbB/TolQ
MLDPKAVSTITMILGYIIYGCLAMIALWGAFCVIVVWRRVAQTRFRSEEEQEAFLEEIETHLATGEVKSLVEQCEEDPRAMPQLVHLAMTNSNLGLLKLRHMVADRFQRDVLADLDFRLSWVNTVIKSAPMIGLLGTVIGMMGAFGKMGADKNVEANALAGDIYIALITTACGLAIAIPLVLCVASITVRIRKMEDLVGLGLTRFFDVLQQKANE